MDGEAAAAVLFREQVQVGHLFRAVRERDFQFAERRERAVFRRCSVPEVQHGGQRSLEEFAVLHPQFADESHAAFPVLFLGRVVVVGQAHPADDDGLVGVADIGRELGGIEVEPVVEVVVVALRREGQGVIVHGPDEVDVVVRAVPAARQRRVLRGEQKDVFSGDLLDAGAFPHAAEVLISGKVQLAGELPALEEFRGLVDEDRALLVKGLGADEDVVGLLLLDPEDLRVSLVLAVVVPGPEEGLVQFDRRTALIEFRGAGVGRADPVLVPVVAGVEEVQGVALGDGGAGVASLVVEVAVGAHADTGILPVDEVGAFGMVPVFEAVHGAPGRPLIEQVPDTVVVDESVRVAGQAGNGLDMVFLAIDAAEKGLVEPFDLIGTLQDAVPLFQCPFTHGRSLLKWFLVSISLSSDSIIKGTKTKDNWHSPPYSDPGFRSFRRKRLDHVLSKGYSCIGDFTDTLYKGVFP